MDVVGGVAAAFQLADVALQSLITIYSVARDMKEVPKKLQEVFGDLESFARLLSNLEKEASQPGSRFSRVPAWQVHNLVALLKAAAACSNALKASLVKVLPSRGDSKLKRTWRALASLPREHDIFVQCDRLQRLKIDMQLDLQNVGISLMSLANTSLDDIKAQTGAGGYAQVSASLDIVTSRLVAIEDSNHRIENLAQAMHRMVLSEGTGRASTNRSTHGPHEEMPIDANAVEMKKAAIECCRHLANYPIDLASAARGSNSRNQKEPSKASGPFQEEFCSCTNRTTASTRSFGPIELMSSHTWVHDPSCQISSKIKDKTSQTIRARLRPFINKTIEIVFRSSSGSGGSSRSQSLKCYNTVSRQLSPAFQLFDSINFLGNDNQAYNTLKAMTEKQAEYNSSRIRRTKGGGHTLRTWLEYTNTTYDASVIAPYSDDDMLVVLDAMQQGLEEIFQAGIAQPTDRDEFGNTLMHELLFTWHYLGKRSPTKLGYGIQRFASYLYRRGVDFGASVPVFRSSTVIGSEQSFFFTISSNADPSIIYLAYYAHFDQRKAVKTTTEVPASLQIPIPFAILSKLDTELGCSLLGGGCEGAVERIHRRSCLLDLATMSPSTHDIVYDIQLNALHYAVLQRSRDRVILLMKFEEYSPEKENSRLRYHVGDGSTLTYPFSAVECAFGWIEGLKLLCTAGYRIFEAIELAVYRQDMDLLEVLVRDSRLSTSILEYALCLDCYSHSSRSRSESNQAFDIWCNKDFHRRVMDIFVSALKSRREDLRKLALTQLPVSVFQSLGLDVAKTILLDTKAARTIEILENRGIHIPDQLRLGDTPVFHSFDVRCPEGGLQLADALYKAGFTEVDALHNSSTPLQILIQRLFVSADAMDWSGKSASAAKWLVTHGASTDGDKSFGWGEKPLLHGFAEFYDGYPVNQWDCEHDESLLYHLHREYERLEPPNQHLHISARHGQGQDSEIDSDMRVESDSPTQTEPNYVTVVTPARSTVSLTGYMGDIEDELFNPDDTINTRRETSSSSDTFKRPKKLHTRGRRTVEPLETRARRELIQAVARGCTTLSDGCDCYCSTTGCLPTHMLPTLFMPSTHKGELHGWVKPWKRIQDDLFSWISETTATSHTHTVPRQAQTSDSQVRVYLEGAIRREIFERLSMAHTCCHGQTIRVKPGSPIMSEETRKQLQEEDAEAKMQLDIFMTAFNNLISSPRRRSWPVRRAWTYWWSIVDEILPPLLPWERGMRYCAPVEKLPADVEFVLLDASAERHDNALREAGYYADSYKMDFVDVIKCHLTELLGCYDGINIETVKRGPSPLRETDIKVAKRRKIYVRWPRSQNNNDARSVRYFRKHDAFGRVLVERRTLV